jgi:F-type H+/Na+-transporting ATPase subunit alpha
MIDNNKIIEILERKLMTFGQNVKTQNIGTVIKNNDGVVVANGLSRATMGEKVIFKNGSAGTILNLDEDTASIILLEEGSKIKEGDIVETTGEMLSIRVSEELLGRTIDPLGNPLDDKPKIKKGKDMPLEKIAPGVVDREPVSSPLKTGIKAIDSMIPIGRGQRELIIGDRQTGKTAIAIDTIINQKFNKKPVICVYVAIGQKRSIIAQVIDRLNSEGAIDYTIVINASASDPASLQYLAPYSGCAIAEYFLEKGKDVLVVFDDLTKHAWAYRQISLVLRRPAGREAYPGDVFYLHSRLLERSVKLNKAQGGGSITALPIIETQANDISAYIPTNVISITDGQIYLQTDLFNAGIRPAINIGQSVSRVGGAAQTSTIKSVSGKLRLALAQYNSLAAFAQFGSELDAATQKQLNQGKRLTEILKQPQYSPLAENLEALSIYAVTAGLMDDIPTDKFLRFEKEMHVFAKKNYQKVLDALSTGDRPTEQTLKQINKLVEEFKKRFE